jgi:hypothetical protein
MTEGFLQYGILGLVVVALGSYLLRIEARHNKEKKELREERDTLMKMHEKNFDRVSEMTNDGNKVMREFTNVLSGLKTLLENRKPNGR